MDITSIYPNLSCQTDRRKVSSPVAVDQRSGQDRRATESTIFPSNLNQRTSRPTMDPRLEKDLKDIKGLLSNIDNNQNQKKNSVYDTGKEVATGLLDTIPCFRRAEGVYDSKQHHDTLKMLGGIGLFAINFPADTADIKAAHGQIVGKVVSEIPHSYQENFSFFRNTLLEPLLKKLLNSENSTLRSLGEKVFDCDKSLFNTKYSQKVLEKLGLTDMDIKEIPTKFNAKGCEVLAYEFEGTTLAKLAGRTMLRIPLLGVAALALLELPAIIKAFTNKNNLKDNAVNGTKQVVKSGVNVASFTTGGAVLGAALGDLGLGPAGSMVGLGIGSYLGSKVGNIINKEIDNI